MAVRISAPLLALPLQTPRAVPHRPFFSLSSLAPTQTLSATRFLPYKSAPLFALIADVDTYAEFVPYCIGSRVTHWSPGTTKKVDSWPTQADLYIGFGSFNEAYTSRLRCDPALGIVEARSGTDVVPFPPPQPHQPLSKHDGQGAQQASHAGALAASAVGTFPSTLSVFTSLVTTWRVKDLLKPPADARTATGGGDWTQVDLDLKFRFANPLYSAVSRAVSDQLAALMIEAFEKQARKKLGNRGL